MHGHTGPVRILLGELDIWPNARGAAELAALFPDATVTTLPGAGHFPWSTTRRVRRGRAAAADVLTSARIGSSPDAGGTPLGRAW